MFGLVRLAGLVAVLPSVAATAADAAPFAPATPVAGFGDQPALAPQGDKPQLATDASGRTVAVWLADLRSGGPGVRTASPRVGEFTSPRSVTSEVAASLRMVTSDGAAYVRRG